MENAFGANLRILGDIEKPCHSHSRFVSTIRFPVGWTLGSPSTPCDGFSWRRGEPRADLKSALRVTRIGDVAIGRDQGKPDTHVLALASGPARHVTGVCQLSEVPPCLLGGRGPADHEGGRAPARLGGRGSRRATGRARLPPSHAGRARLPPSRVGGRGSRRARMGGRGSRRATSPAINRCTRGSAGALPSQSPRPPETEPQRAERSANPKFSTGRAEAPAEPWLPWRGLALFDDNAIMCNLT